MRRWLFEEYRVSDESLGLGRILFCLGLLVYATPRYLWMAEFPAYFYTPPVGLGLLFRQHPPAPVLWLLAAAATALTAALLAGWRTREVGLALAAVTLLGNTFEYSFGKINHDILIVAALAVMSFSGWGRAYAVDPKPRGGSPAWPLALLALLVALAMSTAALAKLTTGWLDLGTRSAMGHMVANVYATERPTWLGEFMLARAPSAFWEFLDWSSVGVEFAFLPALVSLRAFRAVCAAALFFHLGIHFSMDIFFVDNLLVYALFAEWPAARRWVLPAAGAALAAARLLGDPRLLGSAGSVAAVVLLLVAAAPVKGRARAS